MEKGAGKEMAGEATEVPIAVVDGGGNTRGGGGDDDVDVVGGLNGGSPCGEGDAKEEVGGGNWCVELVVVVVVEPDDSVEVGGRNDGRVEGKRYGDWWGMVARGSVAAEGADVVVSGCPGGGGKPGVVVVAVALGVKGLGCCWGR